jgi:hypothetical protein
MERRICVEGGVRFFLRLLVWFFAILSFVCRYSIYGLDRSVNKEMGGANQLCNFARLPSWASCVQLHPVLDGYSTVSNTSQSNATASHYSTAKLHPVPNRQVSQSRLHSVTKRSTQDCPVVKELMQSISHPPLTSCPRALRNRYTHPWNSLTRPKSQP